MQRFIGQLVPFVLLGIALVAFAFGIVLLAYLFLIGTLVGLVLFIASWVRDKLFPPVPKKTVQKSQKEGRIIDSDDWRKL